jgi:hypothetical protein
MVAVVKLDHTHSANGRSEKGGHVGRLVQRFVIFVAFFLSACGAAAQSKPEFRIVASGYAAPRIGATLVWLDERRVLFTGGTLSAEAKARYPESGDAAKWANPWTFVWDTASGAVKRISDWNTVCYSPTYMRQYKRLKNDSLHGLYRIGPPGQELEFDAKTMTERAKKDEAQKRTYRNSFNCKSYAASELVPPIPERRKVVLLREGDGYLDFGARDPVQRSKEMSSGRVVRWYHLKAEIGVELKMPLAHDFALHSPRYSSYGNEYVLVPAAPDAKTQKGGAELIYYVLRPSSLTVEKLTVPNFAPDGGFTQGRIERTKSGLVFSGSGHPWLKWAGIYHYGLGKVTRIERGSITALAVSPDGCGVAYAINTRNAEMGSPIEVKFVNLCER